MQLYSNIKTSLGGSFSLYSSLRFHKCSKVKVLRQKCRGAIETILVFSLLFTSYATTGQKREKKKVISSTMPHFPAVIVNLSLRKHFSPCLYTKLLPCLPCRSDGWNLCSFKPHCAQAGRFCFGCETMFSVVLLAVYCFIEAVNNPSARSVTVVLCSRV